MDSFPSNEFIEIKGVKMTKGALVVLVIGFVLWILVTLLMEHGWIAGLSILFSSFIAAYTQNCVIVGHCSTFAVLLLALYIFVAFVTIIKVLIIHMLIKKGKK